MQVARDTPINVFREARRYVIPATGRTPTVRTAPIVDRNIGLLATIYHVLSSAWGKWQMATLHGKLLDQEPSQSDLYLAISVIESNATNGTLIFRGRRAGSAEYEIIEPDFWKLVKILLEQDQRTIWRPVLMPKDGRPESAEIKMPPLDFEHLETDVETVERLWPKADPALVEMTAAILAKGANP
jgi:hypothetical protein